MTRSRRALLFAVVVAGCKPSSLAVKADATPVTASAEAKQASAPNEHDADPIVDLLHTVDTTVAVSSKVDNPHDYPEHLVDGRLETAWNGKTGDLKGWIAVRVPKSARVVRIEITPGFDKITSGPEKRDLFTMNHRIKKVRISREGEPIKEVTLDVAQRGLQPIDVDAAGGDFRIDVLETIPGTQKNWRELTVSELRVWGRAGGAPENRAHIPKMAIGSLDGVPPVKPTSKTDPPRGPFATVAELCEAYTKVMKPLLDAKFTDASYPGKLPGPTCVEREQPKGFSRTAFRHGPFMDAVFVHLDDLDEESSTLLVETDKGWSRTDVRAWSRWHGDPGCLHGSTQLFEGVEWATTSTGQEIALVTIVSRLVRWAQMQPELDGAFTSELVHACRVDGSGAVACEGPKRAGSAHEVFPEGWTPDDAGFFAIDVAKVPWTSRKKPSVGPAGDLRP